MEKYLNQYVFMKNGNCFYVKDAIGEQFILYDIENDLWFYGSLHDEDIDYTANEVCKAEAVE